MPGRFLGHSRVRRRCLVVLSLRGDGMDTVASYIIRIYRYEKDRPKSLVGIVEEAGAKGKKAFQSYDELWEILNSSRKSRRIDKNKPD